MPEFDEDTYKQKSRDNRELNYEPGKNADKYESSKPGFKKKTQSESSKAASLWVEAAMDAPRKMPKLDKKKSGNNSGRKYSAKKGKPGNRNRKWNRRRKPTLWQRILRFFGLAPKKKNRQFDGKRGSKNQGQRNRGRKQGNKRSDAQKPQGGERRNDNRRGRSNENTPRGEGEGQGRRRRSRRSNQRRQNQGADTSAPRDSENKGENNQAPRGEKQQDQRPERRERRSERGDRRPEGRERRPRDRDRERGSRPDRENRKPRESAPSGKVESVAAPKTDTSSLSLGAVDMGGGASTQDNASQKSGSAPRGKRNRRATNRPQTASGSGSEFVPHPIDLPSKSDKSADNSES